MIYFSKNEVLEIGRQEKKYIISIPKKKAQFVQKMDIIVSCYVHRPLSRFKT